MLHNFQVNTIDSINIVFWSLALQFQLYMVFPILVLVGRKVGVISLAALALALSILWQCLIYRYVSLAPPTYALLYRCLPSRGFEFTAGMVAAALVTRPYPEQTRMVLVVGLLLLPFGAWSALHADLAPVLMTQTWGIIFACCLIIGSCLPEHGGYRRGLAGLTFLGTISYSVILVHWPLFCLISPIRFHLHLSSGQVAVFDFLRLLFAIGIGYLFYLVAERPFINRKRSSL